MRALQRPASEGCLGMELPFAVPPQDEERANSLQKADQWVANLEMLSELDNVRGDLEAVRRQLEQAQATAAQLEEQLAERERQLADFNSHQAYRFAGLLLEVRSNPRLAWKLPYAFAKLALPSSVRHFIRRILAPGSA